MNNKKQKFKILIFMKERLREVDTALNKSVKDGDIFYINSRENFDAALEQSLPDLLLINLGEKEIRLFDLLSRIKSLAAPVRTIGVTRRANIQLTVRAMRAGLYSVVDISDGDYQLAKDIETIYNQWQQQKAGQDFLDKRKVSFDFSNIIGDSPEMQNIFNLISKVVRRKWATVLIRGETGTGKELIARSIHYNTCKSHEPFVEVNCSTLTESLLESELFGHEKGAFTDAKTSKVGLFELAQNGTLFLDEIGDISHKVQIKLLKALEEKTIRRVGGTRDIKINARIITATNRDLQAAIKSGEFRRDLFYRLNVLTINVPPLRKRGDDILLLANHFLRLFAQEYECPAEEFSPEAQELMRQYQWPGNVRELRHAIERITLLSDNKRISAQELEQTLESETPILLSETEEARRFKIEIPPSGITLEEAEKAVILETLNRLGWNKRRTSKILNISRPRLDRKIQRYGLRQNKGAESKE